MLDPDPTYEKIHDFVEKARKRGLRLPIRQHEPYFTSIYIRYGMNPAWSDLFGIVRDYWIKLSWYDKILMARETAKVVAEWLVDRWIPLQPMQSLEYVEDVLFEEIRRTHGGYEWSSFRDDYGFIMDEREQEPGLMTAYLLKGYFDEIDNVLNKGRVYQTYSVNLNWQIWAINTYYLAWRDLFEQNEESVVQINQLFRWNTLMLYLIDVVRLSLIYLDEDRTDEDRTEVPDLSYFYLMSGSGLDIEEENRVDQYVSNAVSLELVLHFLRHVMANNGQVVSAITIFQRMVFHFERIRSFIGEIEK